MPFFRITDKALPAMLRLLFAIALTNMVVRALFELPMMYISGNWLHIYGIGHDIFSIALCLFLTILSAVTIRPAAVWSAVYFGFSAILFSAEAVFASYLRQVTSADGTVFFLPSDQNHSLMLTMTVMLVVAIFIVSLLLISKWRTTVPEHSSGNIHGK